MSHREEFYCSNILPNSWRYLLLTLGKETTSYLCLGFSTRARHESKSQGHHLHFFQFKTIVEIDETVIVFRMDKGQK